MPEAAKRWCLVLYSDHDILSVRYHGFFNALLMTEGLVGIERSV